MKSFKQFLRESRHPDHEAINHYIGGDDEQHAHKLNTALRTKGLSGLNSSQMNTVRGMDHAIDTSPATPHKTLYRGVSHDSGLKVGSVHHEPGYVSTSSDWGNAEPYTAKDLGGPSEMHVISVPKGTRALSTAEHDEHYGGGEEEHILGRGTKFKVHKITHDEEGLKHVHMSIIP